MLERLEWGREEIALARTRRGEWMFGRAECLASPLRLQAAPRRREGMAPVSYTHLDVYKRQVHQFGKLGMGLFYFALH